MARVSTRRRRRRGRQQQRGGFWGALLGTAARTVGRIGVKTGMRAAARAITRVATKQVLKNVARTAGRKALSFGKKMAIKQAKKLPEHALNYAHQKMKERRDHLRRHHQRGGFASFRSMGLGRTDLTDIDMRPWDRQSKWRAKRKLRRRRRR